MNITIVSLFRDSSPYIDLYFHQVQGLHNVLTARGDHLDLVLGYGDSTDGTGEMLYEAAQFNFGARLVDVSHGGPLYGSIENAQRFKQLAYCWNKAFAQVPADAHVVIYLDSDLLWSPQTMVRLIDHIQDYVAVAPLVLDGPNSFYDSWGFRRNGERFTKKPPYHPDLNGKLLQLDSAGGVLCMDADLARKARFTDGEAIVGMCRHLRELGGTIWVDPQLEVRHP